MRDQHSCSGSLKYDEQSLVDFRNLIAGNKDIFSNTGVMIPLKEVGCCLQEDAVEDEGLLHFTREADVRFNKHYRDIREHRLKNLIPPPLSLGRYDEALMA